MLAKMQRNWITYTLTVGCNMIQPLWKSLTVSYAIKHITIPYDQQLHC